ncbi:hypothetical protein [Streptosporangium sp. NPDC002721]|uniref:hypothetical protein n=1 Tax=Streptosporangium sp. NPDC002721 TaxID=3366188 RepID=UPI00368520B2
MRIRRTSAAVALAVALGTGVTVTATPAAAYTHAHAYATVIGYYPSAASCHQFGQQGVTNGTWPWYTCFQSGSVWALQVPW